ncbi:heavy-metal-associated domain-containing protein [Bizionia sp. KMM 8389]
MINLYTVTGMTCNGCKNSVTESLLKLDDVQDVKVRLETGETQLTLKSEVDVTTLQSALPKKFSISEKMDVPKHKPAVKVEKSELQQLFPLFLIFAYISIAAFLLNFDPLNWAGFMLDFMGLFYIVFSFFKLLDLKGFPKSFRMYDPLAKVLPVYGWVYPFIELLLGLMFLMRFKIDIALISTLIILGITTVGVTKSLISKKTIQCACLGTALNLPMTKATFIENTIMIIMAVLMLFNFL